MRAQFSQPLGLLGAELASCKLGRARPASIGLLSHAHEHEPLMIPEQAHLTPLSAQPEAASRVWAPTGEIAEVPDAIDPCGVNGLENGAQRCHVGMGIGEQGNALAHRGNPTHRGCRLVIAALPNAVTIATICVDVSTATAAGGADERSDNRGAGQLAGNPVGSDRCRSGRPRRVRLTHEAIALRPSYRHPILLVTSLRRVSDATPNEFLAGQHAGPDHKAALQRLDEIQNQMPG